MSKSGTSYQNLVDIHCHILPGVDDGPADWDKSMDMLRVAERNGISTIVSTPHWIYGTSWQPDVGTIKKKIERLNELISGQDINISVLSGMEIGISGNLLQLLEDGNILPLAESKYLLIEIPFISLPYGMGKMIFEIVSAGYIPVLAHPERNRDFQENPHIMEDFIERGALTQITAGSLCGDWGDYAKQCSIEFAKKDYLFAIASDGHSAVSRPPDIVRGLRVLEEIIGSDKVSEIVSNSKKIVDAV